MNRTRVFFMLATLLATTTVLHAQEQPRYAPPPSAVEAQPDLGCPAANWYFQAYQDGSAALRRVRAMMAVGQSAGCCEGKVAAGVAKGCEVAQAPKACACVKDCGCCESCKVKKDATAATYQWNPYATVRVLPQPMVATPNCLPPQAGSGIVQIVPVQGMNVVQVAAHTRPVHFATPDLDAHCERMHHRGDVIVLEGNVLLLVKKHAQPVRIDAARVLVNLRDGSFTVESDARPVTSTTSAIIRTSGFEAAGVRFQIEMPTPIRMAVPTMPTVPPTPRVAPPAPLPELPR